MKKDYSTVRIDADQAKKIVWDLYRIEGKVTPLQGEVSFNFMLETPSEKYLLKISRPGEKLEKIAFLHAVLHYVKENGSEIVSPVTVPGPQGNPVSEFKDEEGRNRFTQLITWIDGRLWSSVNPVTYKLLYSLGNQAGLLTRTLQGFEHPMAQRYFEWDLAQAGWTSEYRNLFSDEKQEILAFFHDQYNSFQTEYQKLRKGVVHNDANDNNIIVTDNLSDPEVKAIVDFGDVIHTQVINDLAIAVAYAVMGKPDPLGAALPLVEGYHNQFPLVEEELEFLYNLVAMRLVISVTRAALNRKAEPDNKYLSISEKPAWEVLKRWKQIGAEFALYSFRRACGFTAHPNEVSFRNWCEDHPVRMVSLFPTLGKEMVHHLDLSVSGPVTGNYSELNDLGIFQYNIDRMQAEEPDKIIAGGYLEPRSLYTSATYDRTGNNGKESRTIHLGIDFWMPANTPVHALFDGEVVVSVNNEGDKEYGGLIILRHKTETCFFYTLHGHMSLESVGKLKTGQSVRKGDMIGITGNYRENGNWVPHLHFQIMLSTLNYVNDFPGAAYPDELKVWKSICPDPNLIFQKSGLIQKRDEDLSETLDYRANHLGKGLSLSYREPLKIVRGEGVYLIDSQGRKYLDTVNNVAHVGHEHPRVVRAGQRQMAILNTNTRYLHDNINNFTKELLRTFPEELSVVHFVNSGSEANELALRMAYTATGSRDMIAVEVGYHGNTSGCVNVSSYKFDGRGGSGKPEHTHIVPLPDSYRGLYRGEGTGPLYAGHIREQIEHIRSLGRNVAGFICESIISCGGQIELPGHFLETAYDAIRTAGGICIADEIQVGCGRVGEVFWGFQLHKVVPDIVTIGKPIGNGHPLAAVICTQKVADAFANGMEYFNTYGGNPVSCAIGQEVLQVIREESLQENALRVGNYLKSELLKVQEEFEVIGDIRGRGLFLGIELADRTRTPLTEKAAYLVNRMKELGILMSTDGRQNNVLKIKPPMVFSRENADELIMALRTVLEEDFMRS